MKYITFLLTLIICSGAFAQPTKMKLHGKSKPGNRDRQLTAMIDSSGFSLDGWQGEAYLHIGLIEGLSQYSDSVVFSERDGNRSVQIWSEYYYYEAYVREDGSFEWEGILPAKLPGNINSITVPIQTEGLDFFYQPALTQQEIDDGVSRPDSVIGSYAVYHKFGRGNNVPTNSGLMNYATGKFAHIYTPKAWDASGDTVWCSMYIDTLAGMWTISLPNNWLKTTTYPVTIDPTFGNTAIGGTQGSGLPPFDVYGRFRMSGISGSSIDSLTVYTQGNLISPPNFGMAIYDDSTISFKALVDSSDVTKDWEQDGAWESYAVTSGDTLNSDSLYYIGVVYNSGTSTNGKLYYDTRTNGDSWASSNSWPPNDPSNSLIGSANNMYSMYATYTADATPTPSTFPDDFGFHFPIYIQSTQVDTAVGSFTIVLDTSDFPANMMNPTFQDSVAQNGGGDIRFSSDSLGTIQLACEVEEFLIHTIELGRVVEIYVEVDTIDVAVDTVIWGWYKTTVHDSQPARDATYGSEDAWSQYLFVSHMNESSGSLIDETGGNYDFTVVGSPVFGDVGVFGTGIAYDINAGDQKHVRPNTPAFDALSGVTMMAWYNKDGGTGASSVGADWGRIFNNSDGTGSDVMSLTVKFPNNNGVASRVTTGSANTLQGAVADSAIDGTYVHMAMTWGNDLLSVFHNGVVSNTLVTSGTMKDAGTGDSLGIGGHAMSSTRIVDGQVDNIRVDDIDWPTKWMSTLYNNESSPTTFAIPGDILEAPAPVVGGDLSTRRRKIILGGN